MTAANYRRRTPFSQPGNTISEDGNGRRAGKMISSPSSCIGVSPPRRPRRSVLVLNYSCFPAATPALNSSTTTSPIFVSSSDVGHFALLDHRWDLLLAALRANVLPLHEQLVGADACWERPLAIASIPYGYVRSRGNGPWCLGDQAAVIPSFSGDGISIALHSARLAAEYYLADKTNYEFQSALSRDVTGQVRRATLLSRMLVHPKGQAVAMAVAQLAPTFVGHIAHRTRIPNRCLISTHEIKVKINMRRALTG